MKYESDGEKHLLNQIKNRKLKVHSIRQKVAAVSWQFESCHVSSNKKQNKINY